MFCSHHVTLGYMFEYQSILMIFWLVCHQKFHLGTCSHMLYSSNLQNVFQLGALCSGNLCEICIPVTLHMWHQRML